MHITYEIEVVTNKIIDKNVEKEIKEKKSFQDKKQAIIANYQTRIDDLKEEQKTVTDINVKFAQFL